MTRVHIRTANVYVANRRKSDAALALGAGDPDVVGTQESWWLAGIPGYRRFRAAPLGGRHTVQNAIFLRDGHDYDGHGAYQVTEGIPGDKFAPDRWIVWLRWVDSGHPLCLIDTHINAVIQRKSGALRPGPRLDQARQQMRALQREIRAQQSAGYDVMVTLDANYAKRGQSQRQLWRWSPHRTFARSALDYYAHGIDGIAVPRRSRIAGAGRFVIPGSNHDGFELTAEIRKG